MPLKIPFFFISIAQQRGQRIVFFVHNIKLRLTKSPYYHYGLTKVPLSLKKHTTRSKKQKSAGKKKYQVRNWKEYNEALVNRGKMMFWITEEAIRDWEEKRKTKKRGKPKFFSNMAIETALTLREVFHLPLSQTEGFLTDVLRILGASVIAPDYSTLSKRSEGLPVLIRTRPIQDEPLHIVVDSTGAKVYGEGEWKVRQD